MNEIEKMLSEILKKREANLKNYPPNRKSNRVNYFKLGDDVFTVSHHLGAVIFDDDVAKEGDIECLYGKNMTLEKFESAFKNEGFNAFLDQWCEEEHCTRVLIGKFDTVSRNIRD